MVGAVIGSYQLIRKLGEGGMGTVYVGQHTLLGRRAAVKVLLPALSARPDIVNRFFNEARAVTTISDPGIVQVFDFGYHTDGSAFIVMELLEGEPLDRRLGRLGRLPVHDALRLCRQLASSLAAAHAQRIVHRDLKPENIFLVHDAEVLSGERSKILDFGIAKLSDEQPGKLKTSLGALMGTPVYMSPEQCRGLPEIDHRSDIYALGCVLFHLITGRPPFEGEGAGDIISAHIRELAPVPSSRAPGISPQVDALVVRCLEKRPADRFQSMTALAAELGALLSPRATGDVPTRTALHLMPTTKLSHADMFGLLLNAASIRAQSGNPPLAPARPTPEPQPVAHLSPAAHANSAPLGHRGAPRPAIPHLNSTTTLGSSSGQLAQTKAGLARNRWLGAGLVLVAAVVVALAMSTHKPSSSTTAAKTAVVVPVVVPVQDPPPERLVVQQDAGAAASTDDLPVMDAAVELDAPPDARNTARPRPKKPKPRHDADPTPGPGVVPEKRLPPAEKASVRCGRPAFASVYNAVEPPAATVRAALRTLKSCHNTGDITDAELDEYQTALVSKL